MILHRFSLIFVNMLQQAIRRLMTAKLYQLSIVFLQFVVPSANLLTFTRWFRFTVKILNPDRFFMALGHLHVEIIRPKLAVRVTFQEISRTIVFWQHYVANCHVYRLLSVYDCDLDALFCLEWQSLTITNTRYLQVLLTYLRFIVYA